MRREKQATQNAAFVFFAIMSKQSEKQTISTEFGFATWYNNGKHVLDPGAEKYYVVFITFVRRVPDGYLAATVFNEYKLVVENNASFEPMRRF